MSDEELDKLLAEEDELREIETRKKRRRSRGPYREACLRGRQAEYED